MFSNYPHQATNLTFSGPDRPLTYGIKRMCSRRLMGLDPKGKQLWKQVEKDKGFKFDD